MITVSPVVPVPLRVGVVSLVDPPFCAPAMSLITGVSGARVSTVIVIPADGTDSFPASSVAVAVYSCVPSPMLFSGRQLQLPLPSTVTLPTACGSPVPTWS